MGISLGFEARGKLAGAQSATESLSNQLFDTKADFDPKCIQPTSC